MLLIRLFFTSLLVLMLWLIGPPAADLTANHAIAAPLPADAADPKVLHVLDRLTLGVSPGEIERVTAMGVEAYLQQQLNPNAIAEPETLSARLAQLDALNQSPMELLQRTRGFGEATAEERRTLNQQRRQIQQQASEARLVRALTSPRQLQEVLVDFWFNHFNIAANQSGQTRALIGSYEQQAIRPYVLGKFRDLLGATAHHPAMLVYLNNAVSVAPDSPAAQRGHSKGLNENYARELMELHTLGVDGGYTQQDVIMLAQILTGWSVCSPKADSINPSGFCFYPQRHAPGDKVFLKQTIASGGVEEGEQALDILAKSPATARHISTQLAQYFVADQPPATLVTRLSQTFLDSDGDLRAVMQTLLSSPEFWQPQSIQSKFKTPYQYAVSVMRAIGANPANLEPLAQFLARQGMPLYGCETPDGYKNTQEAWLSPDAMIRRISWVTSLTSSRGVNHFTSKPVDAEQLAHTLGNRFSSTTQQAIAASPTELKAALMLASPEFMYR